ncbi:MAG: hypothetical protein ACKOET_17295 [Verrucomicrobiota bacterium]
MSSRLRFPPSRGVAAGLAWLALAGFLAAADFVQDRFVIGLWVPPRTKERLAERYREIAQAHFNLVVGTTGLSPELQLQLCQAAGLKAIVSAEDPQSPLPDHEACWGYLLADEPGAGAFPGLAQRVEAIRRQRPGRFGYVNLFPNYASAAALGTPTYEEHVARFVREVKPAVLSMDHDPLMRPEADTRDAYLANLETLRRHALAAGIPFWNYFYSLPFGDRLDPTEAQIRWQVHASLAHGARGILYFCYWTPGQGAGGAGEFPKGGALLTAEGVPTRHYEEARRLNGELLQLGPTLMRLTSLGIRRVKTGGSTHAPVSGEPIRSLRPVAGDPPGEFLVGHFRHADGRRAVLLVNHSHAYTAWPTVEFDAPAEGVREVNRQDGQERPALDSSPELAGFQVSLGAGDARLFLLPR